MPACTACGETNPAHARYCGACGASLGSVCPRCSAPITGGTKFCVSCGAPLETSLPSPEMVKLVTVLFADVVGSTAQAEQMQPDDTRALMTDFFKAMSEEIETEGGTVERIIGDAIMADFGVPVAHEDDPLRAVRAARRMLRRLELWNRSRAQPERIQIRIGVNTGRVSAAGDESDALLVTGDAVNVAARLEQSAEPGSILVGERTARAIAPHFELGERLLALKGKASPVHAYTVGAEKSPAADGRFGGALVGRAFELDVLVHALEGATRDARARLVAVIGEAGVGKTRLVEEFATRAREGFGATVVHGRCLPYGEGVTLWPLAEILKTEAGVVASDSSRAVVAKIESFARSRLRGALPDEERTIRALLSTIGLQRADGDRLTDPRQVYRDLLATWRALLGSLTGSGPLLVIVEDVHWADSTMLEVLAYLSDHVVAPVLFVCPTRPEILDEPRWGAGIRSYSSLVLKPLTTAESEALLDGYGAGVLPRDLKQRILSRSEGNPFFLEEMIRSLRDLGYLDATLQWTGPASVGEIEVPDNVQSVILSRMDVLPPREKTVLQRASVVGRTFWTGALAALIGEAEGIEEALLTLEMRGLVDERLGSSLEGEREYAFSHILIRDVASATLPRRARADAHAHTAEWLERTIGDRRREYGELLAHHYEQAFRLTNDPALREKARSEALAAARNAISRAAVGPARALATRALELSMEAVERAEALELLGDVHHFRHDGNAAWDAYVSALDECDACHRRDLLAGVAAKAAILATRWEGTLQTPVPTDEVRTVIERGMTALPDEKPSRERSLLLSSKAFLQGQGYEHNDAAGREAARDALEIAETLHDPDLISTALDASAFWLLPEARYGEIDRIERRRLDLVPRLVDSREISDVYAVAALSATFMGRYGEAATLSEEAVERARGLDPGQYLYSLSWRTLTRFLNGNWDGALTDHAEVETLESKDAEGLPLPYAAAPYAAAMMCHELRGDTAAAQAYLDLLERYRARQDLRGAPIGVTRMLAARAYVHRGEPERAWAWIKLDRAPYVGANIEAACEVVAEGPETRAWEIVHVAREESLRAQSPALALHADRLEGRILARRGRESDKAVELLAGAARGLGALGAPWEEAWTRLILARVLGDADEREAARHAQAALATFEALGSIREAAESRSLLKR